MVRSLRLTAYGAYGVSTFPSFDLTRLLWLEQGGILAIAHVRGGGEMGPEWHEAGRADKKENSITDFIRCAEYLIDSRYTSPSKLAIGVKARGNYRGYGDDPSPGTVFRSGHRRRNTEYQPTG